MKKLFMMTVLVILLSGCNSGGKEFIGKWQIIQFGYSAERDGSIFNIIKQDDKYEVRAGEQNKLVFTMVYDKESGHLQGNTQGPPMDIKYIKTTNHIAIFPHSLNDVDGANLPKGIGAMEYIELKKLEE